jgi:hypothetical protein
MPDDYAFIKSDAVKIERTPNDKCRICGKKASLKVGLWEMDSQSQNDKNAWRILYLCGKCNEKGKFIEFEKVWDEIGF